MERLIRDSSSSACSSFFISLLTTEFGFDYVLRLPIDGLCDAGGYAFLIVNKLPI